MKAKTKQICKKAFVWAFYLLVLVFIVLYFRDIDWSAIKNRIRDDLADYIYARTRRRPMILPVLEEVNG